MADMSIKNNDARITVIGKSWPDTNMDSGNGDWLEDLGSLDPLDIGWEDLIVDPDNLPDAIEIITPPAKTTYKEGERISLSGMTVIAKKNGATWTSEKYKNGIIPLAELHIKPLIAEFNENAIRKESDLGVFVDCCDTPVEYNYEVLLYNGMGPHDGPPFTTKDSGVIPAPPGNEPTKAFAVRQTDKHVYGGHVVDTVDYIYVWRSWDTDDGYYPYYEKYTHNGKRINYSGPFYVGNDNVVVYDSNNNFYVSASTYCTAPDNGYIDDDNMLDIAKKMAWTAVFGDEIGSVNTVTVFWHRPSDGSILSAAFDITVEKSPSGHTHHSGTF